MNSSVKMLTALNNEKYDELREMLKENIREESAKGLGKKKQLTIVKSILSLAADNPHLQKDTYIPFEDKYAFTDGRIVIFSPDDLGYEKSDRSIDFNKFLPSHLYESVQFDESKLKLLIALNKTEKNVEDITPIIVRDTMTGAFLCIDPKYIANLMQFMSIKTFKYNPDNIENNCITAPIYAVNESDEIVGIIFPIRLSDKMLKRFINNPDVDFVFSDCTAVLEEENALCYE